MEATFDDDDRIRQYLLGNLSEQEREELEKRLMTDDEFFDEFNSQLPVIEDELIDDYVHNSLSRPDRERFEGHYLSTPDRRRRLNFAAALDRRVNDPVPARNPATDEKPPSRWGSLISFFRSSKPALSFAFGVTLLLAAAGAWLANKLLQDARRDGEIRVEQKDPAPPVEPSPRPTQPDRVAEGPAPGPPPSSRETPAPPDRKPSPKPAPPAAPRVAAVVPMGALRSGGQLTRVEINPGERAVRVQLDLAEDRYPSYRAEIRNIDRRSSYPAQDGLKSVAVASGKALFLRIQSDRYPSGDYRVTLKGRTPGGELEDVGQYPFRVLRRD